MAQEIFHQIEVTGPGIEESLVLPLGITSIGRHDTNHLVLVHPLVSRRHAELVCTEEECSLTDLGSTHGTTINQESIEPNSPITLKSGDVIELGAFRIAYEKMVVGEAEEDADAGPEETEEAAAPAEPYTVPEPPRAAAGQPPPLAIQDWQTASYVPLDRPFRSLSPKNGQNGAYEFTLPAGLSHTTSSYLEYLPDIYRSGYNNFIARFLALLESILAPIEWNVNNFDLFLDPQTAPAGFLPWLANWFEIQFDHTWTEESQRQLLHEAYKIYRRRGTAWALQRVLEIYTGVDVSIDDQNENLESFTFAVSIAASDKEVSRSRVEQIINNHKPAHISYSLLFAE